MLAPGLFNTLQSVANAGQSHNISLRLHTNATIWNDKYLDALTKYKHVKIVISIDSDVAEHLEYIRYPVEAAVIFENLQRYKSWADNHSNIDLSICITTTPLNVFYLDTIKKNLASYGVLKIGRAHV